MDQLMHYPIAAFGTGQHLELLGALLISFATAVVTHYSGKRKERANQFTVFMKESANFREELRAERKELRAQLDEVIKEREILQSKIKHYEDTQEEYEQKLASLQRDLENANFRIAQLQEKVRQMKEVQLIIKENT